MKIEDTRFDHLSAAEIPSSAIIDQLLTPAHLVSPEQIEELDLKFWKLYSAGATGNVDLMRAYKSGLNFSKNSNLETHITIFRKLINLISLSIKNNSSTQKLSIEEKQNLNLKINAVTKNLESLIDIISITKFNRIR